MSAMMCSEKAVPIQKKNAIIAISGSHGSGKTTLCLEVVAALKRLSYNVGFVTESARTSHYLISGDRSIDMHLEVFAIHLSNELRAKRAYDIVVCDRSLFDFLAYANIRFPGVTSTSLDALSSFIKIYSNEYDMIFRTTESFGNVDNDRTRAREKTPSDAFDAELKRLLINSSCDHIDLTYPPDSTDVVRSIVALLNRI